MMTIDGNSAASRALNSAISNLASGIAEDDLLQDVSNIYDATPAGGARRRNLLKYLTALSEMGPSIALIGEAPGYLGSARTGIPFVSEELLASPSSAFRSFFPSVFEVPELEGLPSKEQSASVMWSTLAEYDHPPLLWAAFPLHPHQPGRRQSNRTPRTYEVQLYKSMVRELLNFYRIEHVIAVGNVASDMLRRMEISHQKVRHPARGGAEKFRTQLMELWPP